MDPKAKLPIAHTVSTAAELGTPVPRSTATMHSATNREHDYTDALARSLPPAIPAGARPA